MAENNSSPRVGTGIERRKTCRVIAEYRSPYTDPLLIRMGEELTVAEKESEWRGWLWCTTQGGKSRWVPEAYVERTGDTCTALCDYDATELAVRAGEVLVVGQEESGWLWCTNQAGQSGWVPVDHLLEV